ncbi:MAG: hypothetical protein JW870_11030 [Candidatus Delongbacteria bacterium]|nr:hypothetical protein [Candidatus Delongbacteria bacterium]
MSYSYNVIELKTQLNKMNEKLDMILKKIKSLESDLSYLKDDIRRLK